MIHGKCMEPALPDRSKVPFSRTEQWKAGYVVGIWLRPECVAPGQHQAVIKKLVMAPPPYVKGFPFNEHPQSNISALIVIEAMNPRERFAIRCADILAIHKFVSVAQ